jgi:hypothetical protein
MFLAAWAGLGACTAPLEKMPPALVDCMSGADAGCTTPSVGSGSAPGGGGSSPGTDTDAGSGVTGCGIADTHVVTQVTSCVPCILANCCNADLACTGACPSLIDCTQACAASDTICVGNCENTWTAGFSAYQDFVECLSMSCSPGCPTLQE